MAKEFSIRLATIDDMKNVFELSNDDTVRQNSIHTEKIKWEDHIKWFQNKINSTDSIFYIAEDNNKFVGYCRIDKENDFWVVTIHVSPSMRRKGYGKKILEYVCQKNKDKTIISYVKEHNTPSVNLFLKIGFLCIGKENIEKNMCYKLIKKEKKVIFMGHFVSALNELCNFILPNIVIVENKHSADEVREFCLKKGIKCVSVSTYTDILNAVSDIDLIDLTIVSSFGLILKNEYIKKNKYIVNFHPGDIPYCRGRHPLPCAIKYGHDFMGITAHLILDEEIDLGAICHKVLLPIDYSKDYKYNENRLLDLLPMMVNKIVNEFIQTETITAVEIKTKGNYYKPLNGNDLNTIFNAKILEDVRNG